MCHIFKFYEFRVLKSLQVTLEGTKINKRKKPLKIAYAQSKFIWMFEFNNNDVICSTSFFV